MGDTTLLSRALGLGDHFGVPTRASGLSRTAARPQWNVTTIGPGRHDRVVQALALSFVRARRRFAWGARLEHQAEVTSIGRGFGGVAIAPLGGSFELALPLRPGVAGQHHFEHSGQPVGSRRTAGAVHVSRVGYRHRGRHHLAPLRVIRPPALSRAPGRSRLIRTAVQQANGAVAPDRSGVILSPLARGSFATLARQINMAFSPEKVSELLAQCHRRCCICHRFCGVKMETDHIRPQAEGGTDDIDNAIPVCFECHAEIHSYNDKHPRGRKFRPEELSTHKKQWLEICAKYPDALVSASRNIDVGPVQALVDELEFNGRVAASPGSDVLGCLFSDDQFRRAISSGSVSMLHDDVRSALLEAYFEMGSANSFIQAALQHAKGSNSYNTGMGVASERIKKAAGLISAARDALQKFLQTE